MNKGLIITVGPTDFARNPNIQGLLDNLNIAQKEYRIHTDNLERDLVMQHVSLLLSKLNHNVNLERGTPDQHPSIRRRQRISDQRCGQPLLLHLWRKRGS